MAANMPWFPFYYGDFKRDTGHLTNAEKGAYLALMMHYYEHGGLPPDENLIRRIACMTTAEWAESRDVLAALFRDGWKHKRIDEERAKAAEISAKRASAARSKAAKPQQETSNSTAYEEQMDSTSTATDEQLHTQVTCNRELEESPPKQGLSLVPVHIVTENARAQARQRVFVVLHSPQWHAWDRYRRAKGLGSFPQRYDKDRNQNGWDADSEWPPDHEAAA